MQSNNLLQLMTLGNGNDLASLEEACAAITIQNRADPNFYVQNKIIVGSAQPSSGEPPADAPPAVKELAEVQRRTDRPPDATKSDQTLVDDNLHGALVLFGKKEDGTSSAIGGGFTSPRTFHQFDGPKQAINVAHWLRKRVCDGTFAQMVKDGTVQVALNPDCIKAERAAANRDSLKSWYVGDGPTKPGAKALIVYAILHKQIRLEPGVHGGVSYEGCMLGADDQYSKHCCVELVPAQDGIVAPFNKKRVKTTDSEVPIDVDGTPLHAATGRGILLLVDCQFDSLIRLGSSRKDTFVAMQDLYGPVEGVTSAKRVAKLRRAQLKANKRAEKTASTDQPDDECNAAHEARKAAHDEREAKEREAAREKELQRRLAIIKERNARKEAKDTFELKVPRGTSHVKRKEAVVREVASLSDAAKERARKESSMEAAHQHELELRRAEEARIEAEELKAELVRIGDAIGRGA